MFKNNIITNEINRQPVKKVVSTREEDLNTCDISVIVVTYNPNWEAEVAMLDSVIKQIGVNFEIVVADDGSKENHFDSLKRYFLEHNFTKFRLVSNTINKGTVHNIYSGLVVARGKYVKTISPGDLLYKEDTLKKWFDFMEINNLQWSFSDLIAYKNVDGNIVPVVADVHPRNLHVYIHGNEKDIRWQYFVIGDVGVGATMLSLRALQLKYIEEILDKVIYAEDYIWRSMMFDGIVGRFYNAYTVLYEYGTGISTSNNSVWLERLNKDMHSNDEILSKRTNLDEFQLKMWKAHSIKDGFKKIFIKGKLKNRLLYNKRKSIDYLP